MVNCTITLLTFHLLIQNGKSGFVFDYKFQFWEWLLPLPLLLLYVALSVHHSVSFGELKYEHKIVPNRN